MSYRQKNKLLIAGAMAFLLIAYFAAFGKTINLMVENRRFKEQVELAQTAPEQIALLRSKTQTLERKFDLLQDTQNFRNQLLSETSRICAAQNLELKSFGSPLLFSDGDVTVETHRIDVQGRFVDIVKALHILENELKGGRLVSSRFYLEHDRRSKQDYLIASLMVQTIAKQKLIEAE